ncbi:uroporphyrinogen-III C-methyltransferase [Thauera sp. CAU 1555]|uniref:uroporphyrinogen-III C-methyltransferase n=1 Tax=Thauera sedimentorum TaxID=2767595 RepID=A0ABR9B4X3_9RHOO|nr:uroporphyrinogen-III C-methyltransferase [Thauera sedimentorum]MBC9070502.1 uroporphyrinogen-III C-methyltransferase [Thauera sedimentorum]MBD8501422.1 uroporphyrinogen-III C-methyltransferase [Thauera sedimentorum]
MSKVYLIGAGPGAADLLTLRAARVLTEQAEIVLADDLVSAEILALVRPAARVLKVGKRGGRASTPQDFIHRLMVRYARRGRTVVRLKGGDPYVFGRGGEEIEALAVAGVEAEVVPGLTAGIAVPAAAGIPVTHRAYTHGVTLVTGTAGEGCGEPNWAALASTGTTLVIYMGLTRLLNIVARLIAAGLPPDTPAAAIASGTLAAQRQVKARLADLPARVMADGLASPAIIVVGEVAAFARCGALDLPAARVLAA